MAEALEQFEQCGFPRLAPSIRIGVETGGVGRPERPGRERRCAHRRCSNAEDVDHNAAWMRGFVEKYDIALWPHGKTSMAPAIFGWQIAQGAEWLSLASATQAHVARQAGINRILIANQVVNRFDLEYLARR